MHSMGKTMNELHAMLKLHEETLPKKVVAPTLHAIRARKAQKNKNKKPIKAAKGVQGKGKTKLVYAPKYKPSSAPKSKNPLPPKKDNPAKDTIYHQCGEVGHWRRNCLVYLAELLKKKKISQGAGTSGIFTIELYSFPSTSWVYDTGCGTHICNTTQGLRGSKKLNPRALSLYMSNGQHARVEAIGNYHLYLLSRLVIVLNNCHYASCISRGIISVSHLYNDGFVNRFSLNNAILIFKNNIVYFSAIPRDGIYEIDLSSSNTNDSSIKKHIEKLQHDGLLNSTNIESLGKFVACMSGKMARKPYSHQVERAKDLLELIHTDDYAFDSATRILNMVLTKKVEKIPYEIWHGQAPKLSYLKVWGCEAIFKRDTLSKPNKLEPRSIKCIFVVYLKEMMGYSFYYPSENKVFISRNAEFFEKNLIDQEASGSIEDLEIIQEEDTNPSVDTSLGHDEDVQEIDEPQSDIL
ncbi:retrotransposon protein, putative, ty1-copia subclass [Tanacetum coccineum]